MNSSPDLEELTNALYLASPALPIGAYSYSQGLEAAIAADIVADEEDVLEWILLGLQEIIVPGEAATVAWQHRFWTQKNFVEVKQLNEWFLVSRETAELRQESEQMGWSLARIAFSLAWGDNVSQRNLASLPAVAFPTAFAFAAVVNGLSIRTALAAFSFNWAENQVTAALKTVPLGQDSGQRLVNRVRPEIHKSVEKAMRVGKDEILSFAPMLAILSSRHESQAFRVFRS